VEAFAPTLTAHPTTAVSPTIEFAVLDITFNGTILNSGVLNPALIGYVNEFFSYLSTGILAARRLSSLSSVSFDVAGPSAKNATTLFASYLNSNKDYFRLVDSSIPDVVTVAGIAAGVLQCGCLLVITLLFLHMM
jgi:hypothetical protein